jgi:hypothetical protein
MRVWRTRPVRFKLTSAANGACLDNVQRWVNVADQDDFIAVEPRLEGLFKALPAGAVFEGGYTVDNGAEPHNANFYLGKAQVGKPIGEVLSGAH